MPKRAPGETDRQATGGRVAGAAGRAVPGRIAIALTGMVSLAVALGIGRFAFTPLLPMMLNDGSIGLTAASWLASANYLGYLVGALLCTFAPWLAARLGRDATTIDGPRVARAGLVVTGLLTLAMALPWPTGWPFFRFLAGMTSAIVFVYTSGWCLDELGRRQAAKLGGAMYAGPGVGVVLSGLCVGPMVAAHWSAAEGWLFHGVLALGMSAAIWRVLRRSMPTPLSRPVGATATSAPPAGSGEIAWLAFAYGLAGFGYIVTATFLPVIARGALPNSAWLDLFWPMFGAGVTCGALLATRARIQGDLRLLLAGAYAVQAVGVGASLVSPTLAGFAVGSLLLGLPFTAITFFAVQEVRRLRPAAVASFTGLLTALYGIGQIVGPPLVARLLAHSRTPAGGFTAALQVAVAALLTGAAIYLVMMRVYPRRAT